MPIQAIIMAGGEGSRLRPLTLNRPKPLVPILGKPCMWYALALLKRHGLIPAAATLCYMPDAVRETFKEELTYYEETTPLGTAGSVRMAKDDLADTFVVLSGDGLTDCDLSAAMRFHREKGAVATLVLKSMPIPLSYGVVLTDGGGRVTSFLEKPDWPQVFSDQVNTGIYILNKEVLDLIPGDGPYDFGQNLFPLMVEKGLPVYGYVMRGYWCDVGDQPAYVQAQLDLMAGLANLPVQAEKKGLAYLEEGAFFHEGAQARGLCYIGKNARVERGAVLYEGAALCENAVVEQGARLERTCLWENARAGKLTRLRGAVLCDLSQAHENVSMEEDTALGFGAQAMKGAMLAPGAKVWPHRVVAPDARVYENVVWGDLRQLRVTQSKSRLFSTRDADALCAALKDTLKVRHALVMRDEKSEALLYTLVGALCARGVFVTRADGGTLAAMRRVQAHLDADAGLFVAGDTVFLTGERGRPLSKGDQRKLETLALRGDYPKLADLPGECGGLGGAAHLYAHLLARDVQLHKDTHAAVFCQNTFVRKSALEALGLLDCAYGRVQDESDLGLLNGEIGFLISENGAEARLLTEDGPLDAAAQARLMARAWYLTGHDTFFLLGDMPRGILKAVPGEMRVLPPAQKDAEPESYFSQEAVYSDGLAQALLLMAAFKDRAALFAALSDMPRAHLMREEIPCPQKAKGRVLRLLGEQAQDKEMGEGLRVFLKNGAAHLTPCPDRPAFMVTAESGDMETAREICGLYKKDIERILAAEGPTDS